ncbi:O-methyltransferase [Megasphaera cerevisiae]|nr:class I SAM-dependent methyltransferase [Megasphaera cerevisiae]SKA04042.1 Predicted O-methyltransferase YrrM [Megasphaera cerevisiae DSM 20462]
MNRLWRDMEQYAREHELPILRGAELPLFRNILAAARPRHVLEIGTCIGYSALQMAPYLREGGMITTLELDAERAMTARQFIDQSQYSRAVTVINGDGTALLDRLEGPWDFVFLDGPKGQYPRQIKKIIPKLLPQAIIVADNMRYHDMIYIQGAVPHKHRTAVARLHEFLGIMNDDSLFETVFFENGDGMTVSRWKGYMK